VEPGSAAAGDLRGRVAVVAGGTRGAGRGIAVALGARGATVFVTGRSTAAGRSELGRGETIEDTAQLVDAAGGRGIAVRCDHWGLARECGFRDEDGSQPDWGRWFDDVVLGGLDPRGVDVSLYR
jgi:NAD(P)-dependent dehydrogenase (short-subunit alcohol dehydrogenase family)